MMAMPEEVDGGTDNVLSSNVLIRLTKAWVWNSVRMDPIPT